MLKIQKPIIKKYTLNSFLAVSVLFIAFSVFLGSFRAPTAHAAGLTSVLVRVNASNSAGANLGPLAGAVVYLAIESGASSCPGSATATNPGTGVSSASFGSCNGAAWYNITNVTYPGYTWLPQYTSPGTRFQTAPGSTGGTGIQPITNVAVYMTVSPPTVNLSASATSITSGSSVSLSWSSATATGCSGSGASAWNGGKATSGQQTISNLTSSTTFTLTCSGAGGSTSKAVGVTVTPKSTASAKPKTTTPTALPAITPSVDTTAPSKPGSIDATADGEAIVLSWPAAADNTGVTGYFIERSTDNKNWEVIAENVTDTQYEDADIKPNTTYYYRVSAHDAANNKSEVVLSSKVLSDNTTIDLKPGTDNEAKVEAKKSSSGSPIAAVGIIVVLLAAASGVWWLRRRNGQAAIDAPYDYNAMPLPTQPQPPQNPPLAPPLERAEHTSVSLKDMVMQDYHPDTPKIPGQDEKTPPK